jgi:hypothetical protein
MTKPDATCPQLVLDWIAWYPDGDLPSDVRSAIEVHAAECSACRQEIAALAATGPDEPADSPAARRTFARTLDKIRTQPSRMAPPPQRRWVLRPRFAVAAGLAVALISATAGIVATQHLGRAAAASYRPASAGPTDRQPAGPSLDVVFRADVPFAEVTRALQAIDATVESGPSARGIVHLRLARGADAAAAARRLESGDLRVADFAQPTP